MNVLEMDYENFLKELALSYSPAISMEDRKNKSKDFHAKAKAWRTERAIKENATEQVLSVNLSDITVRYAVQVTM